MISGASGCGAPADLSGAQEAGHGDTRRRLCLAAGGGSCRTSYPQANVWDWTGDVSGRLLRVATLALTSDISARGDAVSPFNGNAPSL